MAADAAKKKGQEAPRPEAPVPNANAAKPKADVLGIIVFLLVATNLVVIGGMGYYMQKMWERIQDLQSETQRLATRDVPEENPLGKELQPSNLGMLYPLESFLVNISSDVGPKFLQAQMELELADPALEDELVRKKAALRDAVIVLLSSRSYKELRDAAGMKRLRLDLVRSINNLLNTGKIKEIYFTQFHFN